MNNSIKKIVKTFIKKNRLTVIDYSVLKNVTINMGYVVIEFNSIFNEKNVETVIQNLDLSEYALKSRGFVYADAEYRLVFVNEDLNDEEKLLVLSHELGHIVCEHFSTAPIIGNDVREEYEANEFAHYLLNPTSMQTIKVSIASHKKIAISICVFLLIVVLAGIVITAVKREQLYYGEYYVTDTGSKYHKKECIFVKKKKNVRKLTKEDFKAGLYDSCDMCLPDEIEIRRNYR